MINSDRQADVALSGERFQALCRALADATACNDETGKWPAEQLAAIAQQGVFSWFVPRDHGGEGWTEADLLRAYLAISEHCLTMAFIVTQRQAAVSRIVASDNVLAREALLPGLISGDAFATVGISHLTTSRRHLSKPILRAERVAGGFVLEGESPWVTGAAYAQHLVVGATLTDGQQVLLAVPADSPGLTIAPAEKLVALSASHTGPVLFAQCRVDTRWLLAGPVPEVMKLATGTRTGGLPTSALAAGLAQAAIRFLCREAEQRAYLQTAADALQEEHRALVDDLIGLAEDRCSVAAEEVRSRANSLVLRATQSALVAAKGTGFVAGHPAGRWCREALFFLVWSCPQPVSAQNLCEFAGLD